MSDTPETDALYFPRGRAHTTAFVPSFDKQVAFAERLERENAKLRESLGKMIEYAQRWPAPYRQDFSNRVNQDIAAAKLLQDKP